MSWHERYLRADPEERKASLYHFDHASGSVVIEDRQDVSGIVKDCKAIYRMQDASSPGRWKGTFHHVASIPNVIIDKIWREEGINILRDKDRLRRFLNDPDNRAFRTKPGRI